MDNNFNETALINLRVPDLVVASTERVILKRVIAVVGSLLD